MSQQLELALYEDKAPYTPISNYQLHKFFDFDCSFAKQSKEEMDLTVAIASAHHANPYLTLLLSEVEANVLICVKRSKLATLRF